MPREYSQDINDELIAPSTAEVFLVLLVLSHVDLANDIYLVSNTESIVSSVTGSAETYTAMAFDFVPPNSSDGELNTARVTIDAVDRTVIQAVRTISSPATITAYIIQASDPNTIVQGPWAFTLQNVNYTKESVTGDLVYKAYLEEVAGTVFFTPSNFPLLYITA